MSWELPGFVTHQFDIINITDESEYFGPFNDLLNSSFPASEGYQIALRSRRVAVSINFAVMNLPEEKIYRFYCSSYDQRCIRNTLLAQGGRRADAREYSRR